MDERGDRRGFALSRLRDKPGVVVYIEGGGDGEAGRIANRLAFQGLLKPLREKAGGLPFDVVCRGGRSRTFEAFRDGQPLRPLALHILLVDAEEGYNGKGVWRHLREVRKEDAWERPAWAGEGSAYLMVPTVEAWIVKDRGCLARKYGRKFDGAKLPARRHLEEEPKGDLYRKLGAAVGGYEKRDAFDLIKGIDLRRLGERDDRYDGLPQASRLLRNLGEEIERYLARV